jgi:hypothetical protein
MRAFLANLTNEQPENPLQINEYSTGAIASCRAWIDTVIGYDSANLSHDEIDLLRPAVYRWSAEQQDEAEYHKVHDAWTRLADGSPLFPASVTRACLYIVRNPLDVVVSMSHHNQTGIDKTIKHMAWPEMSFCAGTCGLSKQLRQKILSWSEHIQSWYEAPGINLKIVRYEDMLFKPQSTFSAVATFLDIQQGDVQSAIDVTQMKTLQQMEQDSPFKERPQGATRFFRKGIAGDWQQRLRPDQVRQIIQDHGEIMHRLGYLDNEDQPLVEPVEADYKLPMLIR